MLTRLRLSDKLNINMNETEGETHSSVKNDDIIRNTLLKAMISATLRTAVPMLGLFFAGLMIDFWRKEKAFFAIIGAAAGSVIAVILICLQVKAINKKEQDKSAGKKTEIKKIAENKSLGKRSHRCRFR